MASHGIAWHRIALHYIKLSAYSLSPYLAMCLLCLLACLLANALCLSSSMMIIKCRARAPLLVFWEKSVHVCITKQ